MAVQLKERELRKVEEFLAGWADTEKAQLMRTFIQHGRVTTYEHCLSVAKTSLWLTRKWGWRVDEVSLVRAAFLHDYYLYDWHDCTLHTRLHGFTHPKIALHNAERDYELNPTMRDVIRSHMWPLTLFHWPRTKEGILVMLADKLCSADETVNRRKA